MSVVYKAHGCLYAGYDPIIFVNERGPRKMARLVWTNGNVKSNLIHFNKARKGWSLYVSWHIPECPPSSTRDILSCLCCHCVTSWFQVRYMLSISACPLCLLPFLSLPLGVLCKVLSDNVWCWLWVYSNSNISFSDFMHCWQFLGLFLKIAVTNFDLASGSISFFSDSC